MYVDLTELHKLIEGMGHRWSEIPNDVIDKIITIVAKNIKAHLKEKAKNTDMLRTQNPHGRLYNYNEVASAAVIKKKMTKGGDLEAEINFKGTTPRTHKQGGKARIAEVAFLNEYGVPTHFYQKPRPFIKESCVLGVNDSITEVASILMAWVASRII